MEKLSHDGDWLRILYFLLYDVKSNIRNISYYKLQIKQKVITNQKHFTKIPFIIIIIFIGLYQPYERIEIRII